jgi:hypothetical protein
MGVQCLSLDFTPWLTSQADADALRYLSLAMPLVGSFRGYQRFGRRGRAVSERGDKLNLVDTPLYDLTL